MLCLFVGLDLFLLSSGDRQAISSKHLGLLKQFLLLWETSVTCFFVSLWCSIVLISINIFWKICYFTQNPLEEYCTGVVSSVCKSISALDEQCTKVVSYVHYVFWHWNSPGSQFLADFWSQISLATCEIDHNICFLMLFICLEP